MHTEMFLAQSVFHQMEYVCNTDGQHTYLLRQDHVYGSASFTLDLELHIRPLLSHKEHEGIWGLLDVRLVLLFVPRFVCLAVGKKIEIITNSVRNDTKHEEKRNFVRALGTAQTKLEDTVKTFMHTSDREPEANTKRTTFPPKASSANVP